MDEQEYNAIDAIRFSRLKLMATSALLYHVNPRRDSAAMGIGRAAHCRILTPELYAASFIIKPKFAGKGAVAAREAWEAEHADCDLITQSEADAVEAMAAAVMACPDAAKLITAPAATFEQPAVWRDPDTDLACKCKPDLTAGVVLADLKTAADVTPRGFARQCANLSYHAQMAFYNMSRQGQYREVLLIAVQSQPPWDCAVYRLGPSELAVGAALCRKWLGMVKACTDSGVWPGVAGGRGTVDLVLPGWAMGDDAGADWEVAA